MTRTASSALDEAARTAGRLANPVEVADIGVAQSLAAGAAGIALLHLERARTGHGPWARVRAWLHAALTEDVTAGDDAGLYVGAPACDIVVHTAAATRPGALTRVRHQLDTSITTLTRRRLTVAHRRFDRGNHPIFADYDLIRGLTGLGAYHLQSHPEAEVTRAVLSYLVRLTQPRYDGLPGWWTNHAPTIGQPDPAFASGHANLGIAHGITGPLALLALAMRHDVHVAGQADAIARICTWLDSWQQPHSAGPRWPTWISHAQLRGDEPAQSHPRPSWCYGTPGIARAQHLAGIALNDHARQHHAETALFRCLTDTEQRSQLTEPGLCHGTAGLLQTTWRMATDTATTASAAERLAEHLPNLTTTLTRDQKASSPELLTGSAGVALVLHTIATNEPDRTSWDRILLLN